MPTSGDNAGFGQFESHDGERFEKPVARPLSTSRLNLYPIDTLARSASFEEM